MKKYFLDAALLILFLLVMSFHFLPRFLHEIFGLTMSVAVMGHLFLNRRRFVNLFLGKWSRRKIFSSLVNLSILIFFLLIMITGVCMSNYIFDDMIPIDLRRNMTIHQLHVSMPYWLMIFIGAHISLHWNEIWQRFIHFANLKINNKVRYIFLTVVICAGIYGAFLNRVGDRILMKHIFATPATELSWGIFLLLFLSTTVVYVVIFFFIDKKFLR